MLVMRRRAGDAIQIGPNIEIEILEVTPTRVKIGIVAPAELHIVRKEIVLARDQNLAAARPASAATISWLTGKLNTARKKGHQPDAIESD